MKNIENSKKNSFLKRIFIKLSRKLGFEIIDQNTFKIVTLDKKINDEISTIGVNSINLPLGKVDITRPVKALDIIIRTCASVNMLTQNKKRLFEKEKIEYTSRTIHSLLNSVKNNSQLNKIKINFKVIDHNSSKQNLKKINSIFKRFSTNYDLIKKIVTELNIPFIDVDKEVFNKEKNPLLLFPFGLGGHYNVEGYKKVTQIIYKFSKD